MSPLNTYYYGHKSKEKAPSDTVINVPLSEERRLSDNALLATFGPSGPLTTGHKYEKIVYTTRPPNDRRKANLCRHFKEEMGYSGDASQHVRVDDPPNNRYYLSGHFHHISSSAHSTAKVNALTAFGVPYLDAYLSANGRALITDASRQLEPDLTTMSLPNFLLELKDARNLLRLWRSGVSVAKNLAGGHLNVSFGILPTIGDMQKIYNSATTGLGQLADFERQVGILFHRSKTVVEESLRQSGTFNPSGESSRVCTWNATLKFSVDAHCVWKPQAIPGSAGFKRNLRARLDALGFELNAGIAWNAIPFTFLVDWFYDVGGFLEQYKIDTLHLPIEYVDSYLQYKSELLVESSTQFSLGTTIVPKARPGGWYTKENYFQRLPIFPDPDYFSGPKWKLPSLSQVLLLVSLGTTFSNR